MAEHEAIARCRHYRRLQPHLRERAAAGRQLVRGLIDEADRAEQLRGEMVKADAGLILQRPGVRKQLDLHRHHLRGTQRLGMKHLLAAVQLFERHVREIHRRPFAGRCIVARLAVHLHATRAAGLLFGQHLDFILDAHPATVRRPGDDGAKAFHGEGPIDRQAEHAARGIALLRVRHRLQDGVAQSFQSEAGGAAHRHDRLPLQKAARHQLLHFQAHQLHDLGIGQIALRQRHQAGRNAEQSANGEVLARLRLDRLIGSDHQQHAVDAADAGQHVAHEALVSRHVDEADLIRVGDPAGESEIDGDAAALLLRQTIRVDTGQRAHQ